MMRPPLLPLLRQDFSLPAHFHRFTVTSAHSLLSLQHVHQAPNSISPVLLPGQISDQLNHEQSSLPRQLLQSVHRLDLEYVHAGLGTFASLLRECGNSKALLQGRLVHSHIARSPLADNPFLGNSLVQMYGKCGVLEDAYFTFINLRLRNSFSWAIIITAYVKHGRCQEALQMYTQMIREGWKPDKVIFVNILGACSSPAALQQGMEIHAFIVASRWLSDVVVATSLVNMYGKCGSVQYARQVFSSIQAPDLVSWNAMITVYGQQGYLKEAVHLYQQMCLKEQIPNKVTFISILSACTGPSDLAQGKEIHAQVLNFEFESDPTVRSALVNMYSKCGSFQDAWNVFEKLCSRNVDLWNSMTAACAQHELGDAALKIFRQMLIEGIKPDKVTFLCVLNVCSSLAALEEGKDVHRMALDYGYESNAVVGTALVDLYAKCGSQEDAFRVFAQVHERDVISWTTMISAYMQDGCCKEAIQLYQQMQAGGVKPDRLIFTSILRACSSIAALVQAKVIHADLAYIGLESDVVLGNALIHMYGKCGCLDDAWRTFIQIRERDVVSWTAMIASYAQHGCGTEVLNIFHQMLHEGVKPDEVTFISVLRACSHGGLLQEALRCFSYMTECLGITPTEEHYACMIDIFGRAGVLEEAENFIINRQTFQSDALTWTTLLGACRVHGDMARGRRAAENSIQLDPYNTAPYVLLSNIYAIDERSDVTKGERMMKPNSANQQSEVSSIEVLKTIHEFVVEDRPSINRQNTR